MKSFWAATTCLLALSAASLPPQPAHARAPYKKEFEALYLTAAADPAFVKAADAAKCNICHVAGKKKKDRNAYGKALAKLLAKDDEKNVPKIKAALEAVAKEHSDPANPASPAFGERIKAGKLPGG